MNRPPYPPSANGPIRVAVACIPQQGPHEASSSVMPWLVSLAVHIAIGLLLTAIMLFTIYDDPRPPYEPRLNGHVPTPCGPISPPVPFPEPDPIPKPEPGKHWVTDTEHGRSDETDWDVTVPNRGVLASAGGAPRVRPTSDGGGPTGIFIETPEAPAGNIRSVVFVIDRSGSMHGTFDDVRLELGRYIAAMSPEQTFAVILFADGEPLALADGRLLPANRANQEAAVAFLADIQPEGQTDPLPALRKAFLSLRGADADGGKLIQLLTDGSFPDNRAAMAAIDRYNQRRGVRINTVLYGRYAADAGAVLKEIAQRSGGAYRYISPDETGG